MKTLAVHPKEWREFFETFTQMNKDTTVNLETVRFDGRRDQIAQNEVFQKMTLDTSGSCNNMISIALGAEGSRRTNHVVTEPIHLRVKGDDEGKKYLQIEAEEGVTLLEFHSGRFPLFKYESEFAGIGKASQGEPERSVSVPF